MRVDIIVSMFAALAVLLPLTLAAVLTASAIAKWRRPDDLAGWTELGVPSVFRREWLLRLHPWGEAALALALVLIGGVPGLLAAFVCMALMAAYLWLVVRAHQASEDASCACFGTRKRITAVTIVRNAWLTLLAVATAGVIWMNPVLGGALVAAAPVWAWVVGAAAVALTTALVVWPDTEPAAEVAAPTIPGEGAATDELDYVRTRTPAVSVTLADGTTVNLRRLSMQRPLLLVAVSTTCGLCAPVVERIPQWRELLPEVDIRRLITASPDDPYTEHAEPQSLHDPDGYVRGSIADWATPTAVLLGADGLLAGGPVTGLEAIAQFMDDVYESLHGHPPAADPIHDSAAV